MSYEFDETKSYFMPPNFGYRNKPTDPVPLKTQYDYYHDAMIIFETDYDAVAALLPPGFEPADVPTISVAHSMGRGVDMLGGAGYNLVRVNAAAKFKGKRDTAEGNFCLVMWENEFIPIMMGREILGVGKLMAEIPDLWHRGDSFGFYAAENGFRLLEGEFSNMVEIPVPPATTTPPQQPDYYSGWMSWKYIPNVTYAGASLSHAVALPSAPVVKRRWKAEGGMVKFHELSFTDAPLSGQIATVLSKLPIKKYLGVELWEGSTALLLSEQRYLE